MPRKPRGEEYNADEMPYVEPARERIEIGARGIQRLRVIPLEEVRRRLRADLIAAGKMQETE